MMHEVAFVTSLPVAGMVTEEKIRIVEERE
jgi:hypothetical protein